jgi:hypothetical protein
MADAPTDRDTDDDTGGATDRRSTAGAPLWVKVSGIIALVVVVVFVVLTLTGRGGHGPGRHGLSDERGHTPPSGVTHGGQQP